MVDDFVPLEINRFLGLMSKPSKGKLPIGASSSSDVFHDIDLSQPGVAKTRGGRRKYGGQSQPCGAPVEDSVGHLMLTEGGLDYISVADSDQWELNGQGSSCFFDGTKYIDSPDSDDWRLSGATIGSLRSTGSGGGYIRSADSVDWRLGAGGTGNFTVDFWVMFTSTTTSVTGTKTFFAQKDSSASKYYYMRYNSATNSITFETSDGATTFTFNTGSSTFTPTPGVWYHIALIRGWGGGANTWAITVNGVLCGSTASNSFTVANLDNDFRIMTDHTDTNRHIGYIDEFRLSTIARWTAAFSPSTSEYSNDASTSLLMHYATDLTDSSTAAHAFTAVSSASVGSAFSPFAGDFTIEMWVCPGWISAGNQYGGANNFIGQRASATNLWRLWTNGDRFTFNLATTNDSSIEYTYEGGAGEDWTEGQHKNIWHHLAFVKSGNNLYFFINGVKRTATCRSEGVNSTLTPRQGLAIPQIAATLRIGLLGGSVADGMIGWLDEIRMSNTARYTADFTLETAAFSSDANTILLMHLVADYVDSSSLAHVMTNNGTAIQANTLFHFGLIDNDWTISGWFNGNSANSPIVQQFVDSSNYWQLYAFGGYIRLDINYAGPAYDPFINILFPYSWLPGEWHYIEVNKVGVESGCEFRLFVDGVQQGSTQNYFTSIPNFAAALQIGLRTTSGGAVSLDGCLDNFRITDYAINTTDYDTPTTTDAPTSDDFLYLTFENAPGAVFVDVSTYAHAVTAAGAAVIEFVTFFASIVRRIRDYYKGSNNSHHGMINAGSIVADVDATGVWAVIGTGFTDGEIMDFLDFKDSVFYSNGVDEGKIYDGTSQRKWGIVKPSSAPTFAADSGTGITGTFLYRYTFYNSSSGHESSASDASASHAVANKTINLTGLVASADPQVDKIRIYRTTTGGATYFFLAEQNNGITTYADTTADTSLGTTESPFYNDPPNSWLGIEEWDGRIFGFQPNSTILEFTNDEFYTLTGNPEESVHPDNNIDFKSKLLGIKKSPNFNELWVHTVKGIYGIVRTGIEIDPYRPVVRNSAIHAGSHYCIVNIYNEQWFVTDDFRNMSVDSAGNLAYESYNIEPDLNAANPTRLNSFQACEYRGNNKNQYRLIYPLSGTSVPTRMLAANYLQRTPPDDLGQMHPVWEYHKITASAVGILKDSNGSDVLVTGDASGNIFQQDYGTNDNGEAIDWSMELGWFRGAKDISKSLFPRWIVGYFNPLGNWSFNLQTNFDFGTSGGQVYQITTGSTGDRWDIDFIWNVSVWAASQALQRVVNSIKGVFSHAQFIWYGNVLDQTMEMHTQVLRLRQLEGFREKNQ